MNCLDLNNNDVQEWISKEGIETTYKEFLDKGYLPDYKDWDGKISIPSAKLLLDKFLPIDSFRIETLSNLMYSLPVETQAAYLNQVIYLSEHPKKEDVYEEGFHAIFDTLLNTDEKKQALKAGQAVLANRLKKDGITINQYVKDLVNKYPTIYGALKGEDRFNRAYEEELASLFVDSFEYKNEFNSEFELTKKLQPLFGDSAKSIASIINKVFIFFKKLFQMYDANRDTINTLFNQIKNGELKGRVIKGENATTVPATRLLNLYNTEYDDFLEEDIKTITHALTSEETQKVIRNVGAIFFQLEEAKVLPDFDSKINEAIKLYFELDKEFNSVDINSNDNKESIDYLKEDVKDYIKTFSSLIDFEDESVESEEETSTEFAKYNSSANESSAFDSSYSRQLKLRIGKTGRIIKYEENGVLKSYYTKTVNGKEIKLKLIESVDVIKVYYAFARALGNTSNDEERFNRLLKFADLSDNTDTKAFVDQLLYDLFASKVDYIKDTQDDFDAKVAEIKRLYGLQAPGFIIFPKNDDDVTISSNNASIINSILKGFDLWRRTDIIVTFDAVNKIAKAFDVNLNNVQNIQVNQWLANIEDNKLSNFKPTIYNTFGGITTLETLDRVVNDIYNTLDKSGIKLSRNYIKYSVAKEATKGILDNDTQDTLLSNSEIIDLLNNFKLPETTVLTKDVLGFIYTGLNNYYETGNVKVLSDFSNKASIKGRLQDIAQGNGYFDENIPDNTFKGADGKTRYNYQYKTYHLQKIDEILKNPTNLDTYKVLVAKDEYLEEGMEFIKDNYLFNKFNTDYKDKIAKGEIYSFSASGLRQQDVYKIDGKEVKVESDGESIGDMSNRDFMIYLLNLAAGLGTNSKGTLPVYFGNYEASKTYEFINLPIIKNLLDDENRLTELGINLFKAEIEKEYNRIKKLSQGNIDTIYTKYNSGNRIKINNPDGSHFYIPFTEKNGVKTINFANFRGQQFSDYVGGLLDDRHYNIPDDILTTLNTLINKPDTTEFTLDSPLDVGDNLLMNAILGNNIPDINDSVKSNVENILDNTINMFESEGIIGNVEDNKGKTKYDVILLDNFYNGNKNNAEFGFKTNDLKGNLKKTIVSSLLNTMYANQLMQGDQALLYKNDAVDMFKRFKGRNAAIVSFNTSTIAPKLGIYNKWITLDYVVHSEVEAKSGINLGGIDQADAQNYTTVNYMRHALYSLGRLTPEMAKVLDAIEQGEDISKWDKQIIELELFTSVLKTVHFDGRNYLKKSDFMLSKRLTSKFNKITEQEALLHGNLIVTEEIVKDKTVKSYKWELKKPKDGKPGATKEIVRWSDGSYYEVVPRQEKLLLHDRRKVMEGWRYKDKDNSWTYTGKEIMLSMPISASKMLNRNTLKGHDLKAVKDENVNTLDLQYYGLQVETAKPHDKIPDPTQYLLIALNELNRRGITEFTIDGKKYNVNELEDLYEDALTARDNIRIDELKNELQDVEEFRNRFAHLLESSGAEKQTIDIVTEGLNLNNPLIKDKYIAQIFSHFTKDGLSQKRAGDAAPHVSSYGMKLIKQVVKHTVNGKDLWSWRVIQTDSDEYNSVPDGLTDLSKYDFYPDVNNIKHEKYTENRLQDALSKLGEGVYFIDELRHLKPRVDNDNITGYFDEVVLSKFDVNQKDIYNSQKYMFGVRIPSQDKHSGVNVEWVDMLPSHYGSVVSVPKEIVQLSGHDFDVDKLYISKPEGYYTKKGFKQYENTFEDFIKYQLANNKRLGKLIKDGINQERALKAVGLPHDEITYKDYIKKYGYSNRGYINNILLQANQQALANDQTLNGNMYDQSASMTYKATGVLKEFPLNNNSINSIINTTFNFNFKNNLSGAIVKSYIKTSKNLILKTDDGFIEGSLIIESSPLITNTFNNGLFLTLNDNIYEIRGYNSGVILSKGNSLEEAFNNLKSIDNNKKYNNDFTSEAVYLDKTSKQFNQLFEFKVLESGKNKSLKLELIKEISLDDLKVEDVDTYLDILNDINKAKKPQQYLLSNDGKSYVNTNKVKYNVHSMLGHIITHKNNNTGKANIGIDVNWNLLDIVLNKLNVSINPNNSVTININGVNKQFNSLQLFLQGNIFNEKEELNSLIGKTFEIEEWGNIKIDEIRLDKDEFGFEYIKNGETVRSRQPIPLLYVLDILSKTDNDKQGLRVFDVLSTMISSATDEAKEQLNARYGLNVDALNAVLPFVAMGGNLSIAIAIVNQPIVQEFLKYKAKKNYAVLTKEELEYKYINDDKIIRLMFGGTLDYKQVIESQGIYSIEYLAQGLRNGNKEYNQQAINVLRDFLKLSEISDYGNNLITAIKLSKGLPSDLYKFESMLQKVRAIGLNNENYDGSLVPLDIKTAILNNPNKAKNLVNKINIVNEINGILPQYIALKSEIMMEYKEELLTELGDRLSGTTQREIDNELESFIYGQLVYKGLENAAEQDALLLKHLRSTLIDSVAQENTIVQMFNSLKEYIANVPELENNSLIKKLQVVNDGVISYLKLNQLVKLTDTQMTELSDAFTYLANYPKEINGISPLEFTKALQALYIIKDGMQFKYEGVSKVFPVASLSRIDKAINDVMKGDYKDLKNPSYKKEFVRRYFESVKHQNNIKSFNITTTQFSASEMPFTIDVKPEVVVKYTLNTELKNLLYSNGGFPGNIVGVPLKYIKVNYDKNTYLLKHIGNENGYAVYKEFKPQGTTNSTLMSVPYTAPIVESILENIPDIKDINSNFTNNNQLDTINIYAGDNQNADLSNFAVRPFVIPNIQGIEYDVSSGTIGIIGNSKVGYSKIKYNTVEGAFQAAKLQYTTDSETEFIKLNGHNFDYFINKLANAKGDEAKSIGKNIKGLQVKEWDKDSSKIMKALLLASFEQNPDALKKLLNTGNAILTHTQDKTKWGKLFPEILMEVREELKNNNQLNINLDLTKFNKLSDNLKEFIKVLFTKDLNEKYIDSFYKKLNNDEKTFLAKSIGRNYDNINDFDWNEALFSNIGMQELFYYIQTNKLLEEEIENQYNNNPIVIEYDKFIDENRDFVNKFKDLPDDTKKELQKDLDKLKQKDAWYKDKVFNLKDFIRRDLLLKEGYKLDLSGFSYGIYSLNNNQSDSDSISKSDNKEIVKNELINISKLHNKNLKLSKKESDKEEIKNIKLSEQLTEKNFPNVSKEEKLIIQDSIFKIINQIKGLPGNTLMLPSSVHFLRKDLFFKRLKNNMDDLFNVYDSENKLYTFAFEANNKLLELKFEISSYISPVSNLYSIPVSSLRNKEGKYVDLDEIIPLLINGDLKIKVLLTEEGFKKAKNINNFKIKSEEVINKQISEIKESFIKNNIFKVYFKQINGDYFLNTNVNDILGKNSFIENKKQSDSDFNICNSL